MPILLNLAITTKLMRKEIKNINKLSIVVVLENKVHDFMICFVHDNPLWIRKLYKEFEYIYGYVCMYVYGLEGLCITNKRRGISKSSMALELVSKR